MWYIVGMYKRLLKPLRNHSFFVFGARGTGKSTLIKELFANNSISFDLLDPELESEFSRSPNKFKERVLALNSKCKYIIIDEVQKLPKLLDIVHWLIENTNKVFILTGSSARKLKQGQANLLAGRAFTYNLLPFCSFELGEDFKLQDALEWGLLPKTISLKSKQLKTEFLQSYTRTYLKEEVWSEQIIKNLEPFRYFLEVSAQMNGQIINFDNLSKDVGVDDKTIKNYYSILSDTMLGFTLNGFKSSFRKRLSSKPKFYLFDTGIKRALDDTLDLPLKASTSAYGEAFEHFIILEIMKLCNYSRKNYRFSYLRTKDDAEVDLVIERPRQKTLFIEIKSSKSVNIENLDNLAKLARDYGECQAICLSQDSQARKTKALEILPWQEGLRKLFYSA